MSDSLLSRITQCINYSKVNESDNRDLLDKRKSDKYTSKVLNPTQQKEVQNIDDIRVLIKNNRDNSQYILLKDGILIPTNFYYKKENKFDTVKTKAVEKGKLIDNNTPSGTPLVNDYVLIKNSDLPTPYTSKEIMKDFSSGGNFLLNKKGNDYVYVGRY